MIIPLLFLIFAISHGSGAIAGEEENQTLDLLASYPLYRWQIVFAKFASMTIQIIILVAVLWLTLMISAVIVDMEIGWFKLSAACLSAGLLSLAFDTLALAIGCI
jgi:ABC-2 type transport system permease protein